MQPDRSFTERALRGVNENCPWIHVVLAAFLNVSAFMLCVKIANAANGPVELVLASLFRLFCTFVAVGYAVYAVSVWKRHKATTCRKVRIAGIRKETYLTQQGERYVFLLICEPEDGSPVLELPVTASEAVAIREGDRGTLTFQGSRFLGFERN